MTVFNGLTGALRMNGPAGCGKLGLGTGFAIVPVKFVPAETKFRVVNSAMPFPAATLDVMPVLKNERGVVSCRVAAE